MSGHKALRGLTLEQTGVELNGKFLLIKNGAPDSNDTGYAKGAIAINLAGNNIISRMYGNVGTSASPSWKYFVTEA